MFIYILSMDALSSHFSEILFGNIPIATHGKELALMGATNRHHHNLSNEVVKRFIIPTFASLDSDSGDYVIDYDEWTKYWDRVMPENINQKIQKFLVKTPDNSLPLKIIQSYRILISMHIWLTALEIEFVDYELEKLYDINLWP